MPKENTLSLVGDGDELDVLEGVETAFGLKFDDDEIRQMQTVGDLYAAVQFKLDGVGGEKCHTQMTFYRLRRAITNISPGMSPGPDFDIRGHAGKNPNRFFRELSVQSACSLPSPALDRLGKAGVIALFIAALVFALAFYQSSVFLILSCTGIALFCLGVLLIYADNGYIQDEASTLAKLTKIVAKKNYGALIRQGARIRDADLWEVFLDVVARESETDRSRINRETTFFST